MPWIAAAASVLGAGAGIYGAKKSSDSAKDIADQTDPFRVMQAHAQANNVNRYTPFGSVEYSRSQGNPNDPTDDSYSMRQTYSPQMQQLMDSMLGRAGAAPATFESQMPSGLRAKMSEVYGSDVPGSTYTPSFQGFKQEFRPGRGEVREDFNPGNYDYEGNEVANDPYQPYSGAPDDFRSPGDSSLKLTSGETTNRQVLDQLYNLGHIDDYDYSRMLESFQESGSGNKTGWSHGLPAEEMIGWLPENMHPRFRQTNEDIFNAIAQNNPDTRQPQTEPSGQNYDNQAMQALIQAMTAQGGA